MNFSFKKKKSTPEQETGAPVLFGCPDLDEILEYSLPRATVIAILEDSPSRMYMSMIRYFMSAGLQLKQKVLIFDDNPERWAKLVPLPVEKRIRVPTVIQAENAGKSKIAWRYDEQHGTGKGQESSRGAYPYCDLSKNMSQSDMKEKDLEKFLVFHSLDCEEEKSTASGLNTSKWDENGTKIFTGEVETKKPKVSNEKQKDISTMILRGLENSLSASSDHSIKRIIIPSLGGLCSTRACLLSNEASLYRFMRDLKTIARSSHSVILVTVPPILMTYGSSFRQILMQTSDIHITMSPLPFGSQFSHFSGVFSFDKIASLTKFEQVSLKHPSFGVKISKKTLDIEPLYETPQDVTTEEKEGAENEQKGPKSIDF
jgi:PAXNEB protein